MADTPENSDPNSQATDSVPNGTPISPGCDDSKKAFISIDAENAKQEKSSVLEVLKKVGWPIGRLFFCQYFHLNSISLLKLLRHALSEMGEVFI